MTVILYFSWLKYFKNTMKIFSNQLQILQANLEYFKRFYWTKRSNNNVGFIWRTGRRFSNWGTLWLLACSKFRSKWSKYRISSSQEGNDEQRWVIGNFIAIKLLSKLQEEQIDGQVKAKPIEQVVQEHNEVHAAEQKSWLAKKYIK